MLERMLTKFLEPKMCFINLSGSIQLIVGRSFDSFDDFGVGGLVQIPELELKKKSDKIILSKIDRTLLSSFTNKCS
jgi:hypothetical protein